MRFENGDYWTVLISKPIHIAVHSRRHHGEMLFGALKTCVNGIQLFIGQHAISIHWPARWFEWSFREHRV
jgi:hypothetical protein